MSTNGDDIQLRAPRVEVGRADNLVSLAVVDGDETVLTLRLTDDQALALASRLVRECGVDFLACNPGAGRS